MQLSVFSLLFANLYSAHATVNADSLTLSNSAYTQSATETVTATTPSIEQTYLGSSTSDSMSVIASLVSAPVGNTCLPYLKLIDSSNARIQVTLGTDISIGSRINPNTDVYAIPVSTSSLVRAKYQVYLSCNGLTPPSINGTYVVRLTPRSTSPNIVNSTALTLTLTVVNGNQNLSDSFTLPVTTQTSPNQTILETSSSVSFPINFSFTSVANSDGISLTAALVSAPTGSTVLPYLKLGSSTNANILNSIGIPVNVGDSIDPNTTALLRGTTPNVLTTVGFYLYLSGTSGQLPVKVGTYVIRIHPVVASGSDNLTSGDQTIQMYVTNVPVVAISALNNLKKGIATNISYSIQMSGIDIPGKITWYANGRKIPGCINKSFTSGSLICSWKPPVQGGVTLKAIVTPTDSTYGVAVKEWGVGVGRRSNNR